MIHLLKQIFKSLSFKIRSIIPSIFVIQKKTASMLPLNYNQKFVVIAYATPVYTEK